MIAIKNEADINELIEKFRSGGSKEELGEYIKSKLNAEQSRRLDRILHDDKALTEILNSDKARELLKKMRGESDG